VGISALLLALFTGVRGIEILGSCARPCNLSYLPSLINLEGLGDLVPPFGDRGCR
jgi:hypothetical protein